MNWLWGVANTTTAGPAARISATLASRNAETTALMACACAIAGSGTPCRRSPSRYSASRARVSLNGGTAKTQSERQPS